MREYTHTEIHEGRELSLTLREKIGQDVLNEPIIQYAVAEQFASKVDAQGNLPQQIWRRVLAVTNLILQTTDAHGLSFEIPTSDAREDAFIACFQAYMKAPPYEAKFILNAFAELKKRLETPLPNAQTPIETSDEKSMGESPNSLSGETLPRSPAMRSTRGSKKLTQP